MNYHSITKDEMLNGDGIRTVLWVAGCGHHCKGCQNPETWDPEGGIPFDEDVKKEIFQNLNQEYCSGITFSGGDPMFPGNRKQILFLANDIRKRFGDKKSIWIYTGYTYDEIKDDPIMDFIDVLVDGECFRELRGITREWVGSDNQIIWRKKNGEWVPDEKKYSIPKDVKKPVSCA